MTEKLVIFKIVSGDFSSGFEVILWIKQGNKFLTEVQGRLTPSPDIQKQIKDWQIAYRNRTVKSYRQLQAPSGQTTNTSVQKLAKELKENINEWLNFSREFQNIRDELIAKLSDNEEICFIIQANNVGIWQLPWHLWNFFDKHPLTEIVLSFSGYKSLSTPNLKLVKKNVKILVIVGESPGNDFNKDLKLIEQQFPQAKIRPLINPTQEELSDRLWQENWDILFFAGHSDSLGGESKALFRISQTVSLTIDDLKHGLRKAIDRGLKLAIFNSCDGLGLAKDLASLQLPATIVMRERIPDIAAQKFLEYFLKAFTTGKSLYLSVREARERLHDSFETQYPCVSWLPVICQNPALALPPPPKPSFRTAVLASMVFTFLVMGTRWLGILQPMELLVLDKMMRLRFEEPPDQRLLIITVDREDIDYQDRMGMKKKGSLADLAVIQLIKKLKPHQPAVIGLDIYREPTIEDTKYAELAANLRNTNFIDVCYSGDRYSASIAPPLKVSLQRVGFTNVPRDPDLVVRRQIFGMSTKPPCATDKSFSFQIAYRYLIPKGIEFKYISRNLFQIGTRFFPKAKLYTGGYHNIEDGGYEVLLNYRAVDPIATTIPMSKILKGSLDTKLPKLVKGRIILIGTIEKSYKDYHLTPYSAGSQPLKEMPGVILQAHMVSHILSAVLDRRLIIWWLPQWGDTLLVWSLSFIVALWIKSVESRLYQRVALMTSASVGVLSLICLITFWNLGIWLPLVPSGLALIATAVFVFKSTSSKTISIP